ncbi:MAG: DNA primase [Candidatus Eremiobacteraeota bacterium]|nr:DNA primase [Candidatus Eremiobacteraeota bacterium]
MRIDQGIIRELHARMDIASFIGAYVPLRKRGRDLVGLCPFHAERTPSFHVHPEEGYFKCFGCGAAGDIIAFLQRLENVTFPDAVRMLAARAGLEVEEENPQAARTRNEKETIYEANKIATAFFARCFAGPEGASARAYCEGRGINAASIERFSLGYAPESWDALTTELRTAGIDLELASKAGLIKPRQSGGFYDFYRNRLMIPTLSTTGEIIAFGGRALGDAEQKYLNTTTTPVYTKGRHLYALNLARRAAALDQTLIVVEGYLDCIALHQAGFENAVAALGTAFTEEQARELRKYAEHIFLCFDADFAGNAAANKAIDIAVKAMEHAGSSVRIVALPAGEDPDSFVRNRGADALREVLKAAKPSIEFKLDREMERLQTGFDSPSAIASKGEALIREMTPMGEWDKWRVYVAGRLKVSPNDLRNSRFLANSMNFAPRASSPATASRHVSLGASPASFEREVLAIVLEEPPLLAEYGTRIPASRFLNEVYRGIYERLLEQGTRLASGADILSLFAEDHTSVELLSSLQRPDRSSTVRYADTDERRAHLDRIVDRLQLEDEKRRYQELDRRIAELWESGEIVSPELRTEFEALASKLKR